MEKVYISMEIKKVLKSSLPSYRGLANNLNLNKIFFPTAVRLNAERK